MPQSISDDVRAIEEALAAGPTPGPWILATSNSWRRYCAIGGPSVREPITQNDGHPDFYFRNGGVDGPDASWIAVAHPARLRRVLAALTLAQQERDVLRATASAVVARWDTPLWKDAPATAVFINALRAALTRKGTQEPEAC